MPVQAEQTSRIKLIVSMVIFGTIGIFVRDLALPSCVIALVRACVGALFLLCIVLCKRIKLSWTAIRKNLLWLGLSGVFLGFNWVLLFEAYRYTTVATATLCYYMGPILIILASPLVLGEKLTTRKIVCVLAALLGMVCLSGVLETGIPEQRELFGILLGLAAAVLYALIVIFNKKISGISAFEKTIVQLFISAVVLLVYSLFTVSPDQLQVTAPSVVTLLVLGVVHTGLAYYLYFGSVEHIKGQTLAIVSYIDPVIAVLASVLILRETMLLSDGIGAVLILGAALISEISPRSKSAERSE